MLPAGVAEKSLNGSKEGSTSTFLINQTGINELEKQKRGELLDSNTRKPWRHCY